MSLTQAQTVQSAETQKQAPAFSNADTAQTEGEQNVSKDLDLDKKLSEALAEQFGCMSDSFRRF